VGFAMVTLAAPPPVKKSELPLAPPKERPMLPDTPLLVRYCSMLTWAFDVEAHRHNKKMPRMYVLKFFLSDLRKTQCAK
jgi:hypothetical protein